MESKTSRTRLFVSYSHEDRIWLGKLSQHLAVLQRRGVVDLWSDAQVDAGADWKHEIDSALSAARVAVLLVSPAFLASNFIWTEEMPRIVAHTRQGMEALPLIVRPCAWRLEDDLSRLQARPSDGRPLSRGTESQVDSDLSEFTYELAAKIGRSAVLSETQSAERSPISIGTPAIDPEQDLIGNWAGNYNRTRPMRLIVREQINDSFTGVMEYPDTNTVTTVEGNVHRSWSTNDPIWAQLDGEGARHSRRAVTFREVSYEKKGSGNISFDGEYRVLSDNDTMRGAWFSGTRLVGTMLLQRQ